MRILITNDDGYDAPGIIALAEALRDCGDVVVVAPRQNQSGVSAALSLRRRIAVSQKGSGQFVVDGTPADCVHLGLLGGFVPRADIVVSGINDGPNLGEDTVYSGTVAAAVCAHLHDTPALALSMAAAAMAAGSPRHFAGACKAAKQLVQSDMIKSGKIAVLNINVPNVPMADIKGNSITRLGRRRESDSLIHFDDDDNNNGDKHFAIGASGAIIDGGEGTDFFAVANGRVSITPLAVAGVDTCNVLDVRAWINGGC